MSHIATNILALGINPAILGSIPGLAVGVALEVGLKAYKTFLSERQQQSNLTFLEAINDLRQLHEAEPIEKVDLDNDDWRDVALKDMECSHRVYISAAMHQGGRDPNKKCSEKWQDIQQINKAYVEQRIDERKFKKLLPVIRLISFISAIVLSHLLIPFLGRSVASLTARYMRFSVISSAICISGPATLRFYLKC